MTIWLGGCAATTGVTLITSAGRAGIVEPRAADEGCGGMTQMAIQRGLNVVVTLTSRRNPVAGRAIVHDARMIKYRSGECAGVMTDTAILACWYMVAGFPYCKIAIMTGSTVIHDTNVIKDPRYKARGLVAHAAVTIGWHMVRWRNFSSGGCTIVA